MTVDRAFIERTWTHWTNAPQQQDYAKRMAELAMQYIPMHELEEAYELWRGKAIEPPTETSGYWLSKEPAVRKLVFSLGDPWKSNWERFGELIMAAFDRDYDGFTMTAEFQSYVAFLLGQFSHESYHGPIREGTRLPGEYPSQATLNRFGQWYGNRPDLGHYSAKDGMNWYGRGLIQLTGKVNYEKYTQICRANGWPTIDLVNRPDDALVPEVAAYIATHGCIWGKFTGVKMYDYLHPKGRFYTGDMLADWTAARAIVNGDVKKNGRKLAGYAAQYYEVLK